MEKNNEIVDQTENMEAAEFEALNARAQENGVREQVLRDQAKRIIREAEVYALKETAKYEKRKAQRRAYSIKSLVSVVGLSVLAVAVTWAGMAGMIHPHISNPVAIICLCAACIRLGAWFGRGAK